ncbi:MAG: hypothetical protein FJW35_02930 [Acidobacteria bacterium]|nr:hypothetical protein [Acidobacteriota bacterium]
MRAILGIPAVVLAVVIVLYLHSSRHDGSAGLPAPAGQIDLAAVRADLLSIAQAERLYLASHGHYATLDQLVQAQGLRITGAGRHGYTYDLEADGALRFRITARPSAASGVRLPVLSIDQTMQITSSDR